MPDRCTVCAERTGLRNRFIHTRLELLGDVGHVESRLVHLEMVLVLMKDRCTVCTKRTIGSNIVLDALDATPDVGLVESRSVRLEMVLVLM